MRLHLTVQLFFAIATFAEHYEPRAEPISNAHDRSPWAGHIILATAAATCLHFDPVPASCLRPVTGRPKGARRQRILKETRSRSRRKEDVDSPTSSVVAIL